MNIKYSNLSPPMTNDRHVVRALSIIGSRFIHGDITPVTLRIKSRTNRSSDRQKYHVRWCARARALHLRFRFYSRSVLGTINLISRCSHISSSSVSLLTDSVPSSSRSTWQHALVRHQRIRYDERFDLPTSSRINSEYDAGRKKMINSYRSLIYDGHMWRGNYRHEIITLFF